MKYFLIMTTLISMNLMASQKCQSIHITDSCTEKSNNLLTKFLDYHFEMSFTCETNSSRDYKKTVVFKSLRAEIDCERFLNNILENKMSIAELNALIAFSSPFSKAKIKTIGSQLPSSEETNKARMNWMRSRADSQNKKASSNSEAMKLRRQ